MTPLIIISLFIGIPTFIATLLSQVYFWQRKEYRWDRMFSAMTSPELMINTWFYLIALALTTISWYAVYILNYDKAQNLGLLSLILLFVFHLYRISQRGLYRPKPTQKSIVFLLVTGLISTSYFISVWPSSLSIPLHLSTGILLLVPVAAITLLAVNLLTNWRKRKTIAQAKHLRRLLSNIKAIGITGSFGKTTTKHFLAQLLPEAIASKEHRNSEYVIAQDMLEQLTQQSKIYLAEHSAYKKGEIADLGNLTQPQIGVITNIGNQHLDLFKSQANILEAKWELIEALPNNGIAVLNADDRLIQTKASAYKGKIIWYSLEQPSTVHATNVVFEPRQLSFTLHIEQATSRITIPLASEASLGSVIAAAATAFAAGLSSHDIFQRLVKLKPYSRTMEICPGPNGSTFIDDSYSANEAGVLIAIKHLSRFTETDKRVVTVPLIELGRDSTTVHTRIGNQLKESGAKVYVYGLSWHKLLGGEYYTSPIKLVADVTKDISSNTVILLEGRVPDILRQALK